VSKLALSALLLFAVVFGIHAISPVSVSGDSRWAVHVALSLWDEGNVELSEFRTRIEENEHYGIECVNRGVAVGLGDNAAGCVYRYYSHYPVGGPVLASPLFVALRAAAPLASGIGTGRPALKAILAGDLIAAHGAAEIIVASIFVAATSVLLLLIARRFLSLPYAVLIPLIFAFATPAWSTVSRAFWQHTPSIFLITATIWLFLQAERREWRVSFAGFLVALSYAVRPTNAVFVLVVTLCVLVRHRRWFLAYIGAAVPVALVFFFYNWSTYAELLSPYYSQRPYGFEAGAFARSAAANLISPARGLFIYMPAALFSIYGAWLVWKRNALPPVARYLSVWVILHWLAVSSFLSFWWAGFSYGPRFFSDTLPVLMLLLIPVLRKIEDKPRSNAWLASALAVCVLFGAWIHWRGAWRIAVHQWNTIPVSVDLRPERVWDWSDPPFLR
jgi:hypothetical protein